METQRLDVRPNERVDLRGYDHDNEIDGGGDIEEKAGGDIQRNPLPYATYTPNPPLMQVPPHEHAHDRWNFTVLR
jgi:hypothetical protein